MIKNTYYKISDKHNMTLAVFSDIHYTQDYPIKRLETILKSLRNHKPNYICIVGDILDQADVLENKKAKDILIHWFYDLSKIAPVMVVLGNHDTFLGREPNYRYPKEMVKDIALIPDVYILDNRAIVKDSICFLGYTLPNAYYDKPNQECVDSYTDDIDEKLLSYLSNQMDTILLCHTPIYVTDSKVRTTATLRMSNLVLCGHMHNGIVPISCRGNGGIISPSKKFFPKYARGHFLLDNRHYVISGSVITFSNLAPKILHPFNIIYPIHIEYITI